MNYTPVTTYYYLDNQPVRIFFTDNRLYFIAHDICNITGLSITNIDDKYKDLKKVLTAKGQKELFVFNTCQLFQVLEKYKRFENVSLAVVYYVDLNFIPIVSVDFTGNTAFRLIDADGMCDTRNEEYLFDGDAVGIDISDSIS